MTLKVLSVVPSYRNKHGKQTWFKKTQITFLIKYFKCFSVNIECTEGNFTPAQG